MYVFLSDLRMFFFTGGKASKDPDYMYRRPMEAHCDTLYIANFKFERTIAINKKGSYSKPINKREQFRGYELK
jgi:hypothetical protein